MNQMKPKALPIVLSVAGAAGVVGTTICAIKDTKKYLQSPKADNKKDKIKEILKKYWPTLLSGTVTLSTVISGTIVSNKAQLGAMAAAGTIAASSKKLFDKLPSDIKKNIIREVGRDEVENRCYNLEENEILVYNQYTGMFKCKFSELLLALDRLKDRLGNNDEDSSDYYRNWMIFLIDFMKDIKGCDFDEELPALKVYGWCQDYIPQANDLASIHYYFEDDIGRDGTPYKILTFDVDPYIPDKDGFPLEYEKSGELAESNKFGGK